MGPPQQVSGWSLLQHCSPSTLGAHSIFAPSFSGDRYWASAWCPLQIQWHTCIIYVERVHNSSYMRPWSILCEGLWGWWGHHSNHCHYDSKVASWVLFISSCQCRITWSQRERKLYSKLHWEKKILMPVMKFDREKKLSNNLGIICFSKRCCAICWRKICPVTKKWK